jgi:sugar transferase (PEP-CTERM/EpsH1 system associated)
LKILFLTSRFPYPLTKGDKLRAYHQIRELAKQHEIHLISIVDEDPSKDDLDKISDITSSLHIIQITPVERYLSLLLALFSGIPFQIAWFYSSKIHRIIKDIAADIYPDHIFCQLTRMAEYTKDLPYSKTLDYMDCFGLGMERRATIASGFTSFIYKQEAQRMIRYEEKAADYFDHLTIISAQDKSQFTFPAAKNIHIVSNGISNEFFTYEAKTNKKYDLVFVGNMSYLPNVESVEYLVNKILPLLNKNLSLLIAGTDPAPAVMRLASGNICISGWVEDIRRSYAEAKLFVAPMWSGTGQQNKILEAMAMGIPCITTKVVNNAIGAMPDEEIVLAETPEEFAFAIQKLLANTTLYFKISTNAKIFVKQNFDWKQNGMILSSIFAQN